jgi:hypothetical protein
VDLLAVQAEMGISKLHDLSLSTRPPVAASAGVAQLRERHGVTFNRADCRGGQKMLRGLTRLRPAHRIES